MGFFKKIFPKPKDVLKSPKTLIKAKPKDKIKDFLASPKALFKGDIGGALNYAARPGGSLVDAQNAAAERAKNIRRASAAEEQFNFYSQAPTMRPQNLAPITPPSYGGLNDFMSRLNQNPGLPNGTLGGYSLPQPGQYGMLDNYVSRINGGGMSGYSPPPVPQQQPPQQPLNTSQQPFGGPPPGLPQFGPTQPVPLLRRF